MGNLYYSEYDLSVDSNIRKLECVLKMNNLLKARQKSLEKIYSGTYCPSCYYSRSSLNSSDIKLVDFNEKKGTTVVKWKDGTITKVKVQVEKGDLYNPETGLAMCIAKKALGNKGNFNEVFKKWLPESKGGN